VNRLFYGVHRAGGAVE